MGLRYAETYPMPQQGADEPWPIRDPLGFHAGDANLYRYVGNNPTNNTDPSGLQQVPVITVAPPKVGPEEYKNFPDKVHDASSIVFHVVMSALNPKESKIPRELMWEVNYAFINPGQKAFVFDSAERQWKAQNGEGWEIRPKEFRLTGLRFDTVTFRAPNRTPIPGRVGELGPGSTEPRRTSPLVPIWDGKMFSDKALADVPVAHFIIDGYFIYEASKGEKKEEFAFYLDSRARTILHSPYDEKFAKAIAAMKADGKTFGRISDNLGEDWAKEANLTKYKAALDQIAKLLRVMPGDKLADKPGIKVFKPDF